MKRILTRLTQWLKPEKKPKQQLEILKHGSSVHKPWWGTYEIEAGQSRFWKVGNVIICVNRFTNEWHVASCQTETLESQSHDTDMSDENLSVPTDKLKFKTYVFKTQAEITLSPVLADRPLASRLENTLYIPAGEEILLYVSSPVWVSIKTGQSDLNLDEVPTFILSDTWVGQNTMEGELCYAGQTHCSPRLNELPYGPDRIIIPMIIRNDASSTLLLDTLSAPLPYLSVYRDHKNYLWTEQLILHRESDSTPIVFVEKGPPLIEQDIELLSPARKELKAGSHIKQFLNLLVGH